MAERRMFAKKVVLSDAFMQMLPTSRWLYICLNLHADDDGFVGNPKAVLRLSETKTKHMDELIEHNFVTVFDSGVLHITHWKDNNTLRKNRITPTVFKDELAAIWQPDGSQMSAQEKIREDKRKEKNISEEKIREDKAQEHLSGANAQDLQSDHIEILDFYQKLCPSLIPCEALDDDQVRALTELMATGVTKLQLYEVFEKAERSPFLSGKNKEHWTASLNWLLQPKNFKRVSTGTYDEWIRSKDVKPSFKLGVAELDAIRRALKE